VNHLVFFMPTGQIFSDRVQIVSSFLNHFQLGLLQYFSEDYKMKFYIMKLLLRCEAETNPREAQIIGSVYFGTDSSIFYKW
jgi:hypothetical protein